MSGLLPDAPGTNVQFARVPALDSNQAGQPLIAVCDQVFVLSSVMLTLMGGSFILLFAI
ncbi:hypothetical protein [Bradyrhizobium sp. NP1]|uniref:hypothetical protein n=1 Tax=Bradyrhizobium sp. NP1 TaxID=3049772 RepID=UPI0025A67E5E|nr:hypothetical protein [Bradyrhizobium sp. NP1]WJR78443.1 hypothetical protein QOU61_01080 [Bradyrhizobium sp. NP1]